jgi:hypothetical protein
MIVLRKGKTSGGKSLASAEKSPRKCFTPPVAHLGKGSMLGNENDPRPNNSETRFIQIRFKKG